MDESQKHSVRSGPGNTVGLLLFILTWMCIFILGLHINASPSIDALASPNGGVKTKLLSFLVVLLCWTWSNLLALSCVAAIVGEMGHTFFARRASRVNYRGALLKGFFVYQMALAGQVIVQGSLPSESPQLLAGGYFRLAGTVSLLSFLVGYSPHLFAAVMQRALQLSEGSLQSESPQEVKTQNERVSTPTERVV